MCNGENITLFDQSTQFAPSRGVRAIFSAHRIAVRRALYGRSVSIFHCGPLRNKIFLRNFQQIFKLNLSEASEPATAPQPICNSCCLRFLIAFSAATCSRAIKDALFVALSLFGSVNMPSSWAANWRNNFTFSDPNTIWESHRLLLSDMKPISCAFPALSRIDAVS